MAGAEKLSADVGMHGECGICRGPCVKPTSDEHVRHRYLCTHCGALLFPGEAVATKPRAPHRTVWRGRFCCGNGSVHVEPVARSPAVDALFADASTGKLLREHARQINNALALASAKCKTPPVPGRSYCRLSIVGYAASGRALSLADLNLAPVW